MSLISTRRRVVLIGAAVATLAGGLLSTAPAQAATCSNVQVVFARGSGESAGLGITGTPFVNSLTSDLSGQSVSSYAVNYGAALDQSTAGAGATDMTNHIVSVAASCPGTKFVLGGYSQGASVTDISIGIPTTLGTGQVIPAALAPRIAAIVVFGNPLALSGKHIPTASATYGARSKEFCNFGDPVCGNGYNTYAHLTYGYDGSTTSGATFAAARVNAG